MTAPVPHQADLALLSASLAGDTHATEEAVQRLACLPRVLWVLNQRAGRPLDKEGLADLSQDVWEILWRKRETYLGLAKLETWVTRIAALEYRNAVRRSVRQRRRNVGAPGEEGGPEAEPSYVPPDQEPLDLVRRSLDKLGPPDAEVIRLKHYDDLTFEQIGTALETSPNNAKFWYYRGIERLRTWLGPLLEETHQ